MEQDLKKIENKALTIIENAHLNPNRKNIAIKGERHEFLIME